MRPTPITAESESDPAGQSDTRAPTVETAEPDGFLGFRPIPDRGTTVSNALINQLREDEGI